MSMFRTFFLCVAFIGGWLPAWVAQAEGMTRAQFEQFVDMRLGTGAPIYWYGTGTINAFPTGEVIATVEGVDTGRLYRPNPDAPVAYQLSRKFIVFKNPKTGQIMDSYNGTPMPFNGYPYQ